MSFDHKIKGGLDENVHADVKEWSREARAM